MMPLVKKYMTKMELSKKVYSEILKMILLEKNYLIKKEKN